MNTRKKWIVAGTVAALGLGGAVAVPALADGEDGQPPATSESVVEDPGTNDGTDNQSAPSANSPNSPNSPASADSANSPNSPNSPASANSADSPN